jgi:DNA excision repair protein ERCC-2
MNTEEYKKEVLFPYTEIRPSQKILLEKIDYCLKNQENLLTHAPTGLGKTIAALAPAISLAIKKDLTVFFLTSRHTQHKLAMRTFNDIRDKYNLRINAVDIIGKKWLCLQPGVLKMPGRDFSEYCKKLREEGTCEYYEKFRKKGNVTTTAKEIAEKLITEKKTDTSNIIKQTREAGICPYEITSLLAKKAKVIIGDYFYIFNPFIRDKFLKRIDKELKDIIIITDEGHNLPERLKDLATTRVSTNVLARAIDEAKKLQRTDIQETLEGIQRFLNSFPLEEEEEKHLSKSSIQDSIKTEYSYNDFIRELEIMAENIRDENKRSSLGTVATFLDNWKEEREGFTRIITNTKDRTGKKTIIVNHRCLDPSVITKEVIREAYCTVLMSGTLQPLHMYKEVLGFDSSEELELESPFPKENKLNIIIPKTSTKYESRNEEQYKSIAHIIENVTKRIPGNSAVFFPSYYLRDQVNNYFSKMASKTVFLESSEMSKAEKLQFLESFKQYKKTGAVLMGVNGGNFSEGVDLPGDLLKSVVIVGLPLQKPSLETKSLIDYYQKKFGKGWDYGYLFPAFNKTLQSAGRCIRTEKDRGIVVFLDERYAWNNYLRCFPKDWNMRVSVLYPRMIEEFFGN